MCTVSYLPLSTGGYIFTSNRDETPARSPERLSQITTTSGQPLILPRDTAGGSWIVLAQDGRLACLLNGAFRRHQRVLPYRRSRGLVVLDFFDLPSGQIFWEDYDLSNIEPFTLISIEGNLCLEGRWDGQQRHLRQFAANEPQIWASATLYTPEMVQEREHWWNEFIAKKGTLKGPSTSDTSRSGERVTPAEVLNFHLNAGNGDPATNLRMARPQYGVETVSVSQIIASPHDFRFDYHDLVHGQLDQRILPK